MLAADPPETDHERTGGRPTCYRCFRPKLLCYCDELPRVANRTAVIIVQHPREEFHPINTARLTERCLEHCSVVRGSLDSLGAQIEALGLDEHCALLFPSADAVDLAALGPDERPHAIVVVDGTWHQAKTLLRDLPQLAGLRRVRFTPEQPSDYRIRKEPQPSYLSTLESVGHVLTRLEPSLDVGPLYELFRSVIDRNIAARRPAESAQRFRFRGRGRDYQLPEMLLDETLSSVALYAEGIWGSDPNTGARTRNPLIAVGQDLTSGRRLRTVLWVGDDIRPELLAHLGLTPSQYRREALSQADAQAQWATFLQDRRAVAFHPSSRVLLEQMGVKLGTGLLLKGTYCDWRRASGAAPEQWGSLDEICEREGLGQGSERAQGRAELRLDQTLWLLNLLQNAALERRSPSTLL